jgi:predicted ATPase
MIRSVEITNLRGIQSGKLENLTPLTILVGPNSSGKSTVLDALLIAASSTPWESIGLCVNRRVGLREGARWLFWKGDETQTAEIVVGTDSDEARKYRMSLENVASESRVIVWCQLFTKFQHTNQPSNWQAGVKFGTKFTNTNVHSYLGELQSGSNTSEVRLVDSGRDDLQMPLHRLYTKAIEQGRRRDIKETIAKGCSKST